MNLSLYDVMAHLIPGSIVIGAISLVSKDIKVLPELHFLLFAYGVGFIIQAISNWIEPLLHMTWGGKPEKILLAGKGGRFKVTQINLIRDYLKARYETSDPHEQYRIAASVVRLRGLGRIEALSNSYAFSRAMLVAVFGASLVLNIYATRSTALVVCSVVVVLIAWNRCRERAYHKAREVFEMYLVGEITKPTSYVGFREAAISSEEKSK